ncbi:MAG: response regulator [Vulcanimicrobiota bacterium]
MIKVLIVEDYQLIRMGIKSNLQKEEDIEIVAEVDNVDDAIKKTEELKPDIVLMDLKLGEDENAGIKATRKIKDINEDSRILILTFYDDEDHISKAIDARVDGYMLKDVDRGELIKAIHTIHKGKAAIHPTIAAKMMHHMAEKSTIDKKKKSIIHSLSSRELEVYELLVKGMSNKDIASTLYISEATVKAHISSILRKLEVTDRVQAVILALNLGVFK